MTLSRSAGDGPINIGHIGDYMENSFTEIEPEMIADNIFRMIGSDWMLITAGTPDSFNTMTANWGGLGYLWNKNVSYCFIRHQRYTFEFMERSAAYTLSFFDEKHRKALEFCGAKSGKDVDKVKETGLTPVFDPSGGIYFGEARLVIECNKIYSQDIDPANMVDKTINLFYPHKDYHRLYIGEVARCLSK